MATFGYTSEVLLTLLSTTPLLTVREIVIFVSLRYSMLYDSFVYFDDVVHPLCYRDAVYTQGGKECPS